MEGSLTIFGEKGTVKIGGQYLNELISNASMDILLPICQEAEIKPNNYGNYVGSMSNHDKVYDNIIDVLNNNASITTSGLKA